MSKFIPLNTFKPLLEGLDLFTDNGLEELKGRIISDEGKQITLKFGCSETDIKAFIQSLNSSQTVLFQNWVEQNENLKACLLSRPIESYRDVAGIESHQFFSAFKKYISPYLTNELLARPSESDKDLEVLFTFVHLLDSDDRSVVESQLFKPVRSRLVELDKSSLHFTEEQQLIDAIKPLCSDEIINLVNALSKPSYALKVQYVDTIVNTIKTNGCTVRFANWIFKQMERLELNNEHKEKISELRKDLREGKMEVRNHGSGKTPIRWRSILTFLFVIILGGGAFYVIYFKPFSQIEDIETADTSSFKKFTKEERKKIDSLIQTMSNPLLPDDNQIDPGFPIGNGVNLTLRNQSKNDLMERIYDDLSKDAAIQINQTVDSCDLQRKKFKRYSGVKDLMNNTGSVDVMVKNESEYDVVFYVAENRNGGKVYSLFLKQGDTKQFQMSPSNMITVVAGNTYIPYKSPSNINTSDLPSSSLKYHFCDTDANYEESINTSYEYVDVARKKTKFMIIGSLGSYFSVMDIYGVLSPF